MYLSCVRFPPSVLTKRFWEHDRRWVYLVAGIGAAGALSCLAYYCRNRQLEQRRKGM